MLPSEIRAQILCEHDQLRTQFAHVGSLAARVLCGQPSNGKLLRVALRELTVTLEKHMSTEEEVLVPAILDVDSWGPVRAERMMREHEAQRAIVFQLTSLSRSAESAELARSAEALTKSLFDDMRWEERELLHPDLLRDDVVSIAQFVG